MKAEKPLSFFHIALLYVGAIMGAGFASGRETWQFFGVFSAKGIVGVLIAGVFFTILGGIIAYLGNTLRTNDIGTIVLPFGSDRLRQGVSITIALFIYVAIVSLSAAGGSLMQMEFGFPKPVGGAVIVLLVILTVLGDFQRISKVFRRIMPLLFGADVLLCLYFVFFTDTVSHVPETAKPSPLAPQWFMASIIYVSYNFLVAIPILSEGAMHGKNSRHSYFGACLGGSLLCGLSMVLLLALSHDGALTEGSDLPMLSFAAKLPAPVHIGFVLLLFLAIYASATSCYYGFTTMLKPGPKKNAKVIGFAILGFFLGLFGFKNVITYILPVEGYGGALVIVLLIWHFFQVRRERRPTWKSDSEV